MKKLPVFIVAALLAAASLYGFFRLFELRFQAGDVYPPYSSLRADPLGMEVLHDALKQAPGFAVARNYQPLDKIGDPAGAAVIYAGISGAQWQVREVERFEALAGKGARIIVTFLPRGEIPARDAKRWRKKEDDSTEKRDDSKPGEESEVVDLRKIASGWGVTLAYRMAKSGTGTQAAVLAGSMLPGTEPTLSWHSALYFPNPTPAWHVLYRCEGAPVIMERAYGRGSIVLAADSYFLSNEAMRKERAPRLIAALLGPDSQIIFDETHLGVREQPGISTLILKYNLGALLAALAMLAALFVWQTSSPFLPPRPDHEDGQIVTGKDSTAGFVSLLRRGIAPSRLIAVCVEQWKESLRHNSPKYAAIRDRVDAAALQGGREPVITYRAISQILAEKK